MLIVYALVLKLYDDLQCLFRLMIALGVVNVVADAAAVFRSLCLLLFFGLPLWFLLLQAYYVVSYSHI